MVCLCVWMTISGKATTGKVLGIVFPVPAFVAGAYRFRYPDDRQVTAVTATARAQAQRVRR